MLAKSYRRKVVRWLAVSMTLVLGTATAVAAAPASRGWSVSPANVVASTQGEENVLRLVTGKSVVIKMRNTVKKVSVANPQTADVVLINSHQVQVNPLQSGETAVIVWDNLNRYKMFSLVISDSLHEQVVLEVTVAEVNRTEAERHGFDFRATGGQFGTVSQFGKVASLLGTDPPTGTATFPVSLAGEVSFAVVDFKNDIAAYIKMIEEANFAHILAEPKLMARSGQKAKFLSGGEVPVIIAENLQTSIEYKEFGTKVEFLPVVEPDDTIRLQVLAEVSAPDPTNSVILNSFAVPAFVTRRAQTDVMLQNNESLVIAGLLRESTVDNESKMPFFGDLPVIGYFFRSTNKSKEKTELVIIVKPRIVKGHDIGAGTGLEKRTKSEDFSGHNGSLDHIQKRIHEPRS